MFNKITIKNFKSLAETSTELGQFTVLVGANGSGKSSFLQAIELVSWAVRSPSINDELQANNVEFRDLVHLRASKVAIGFEAELTVEVPDEGTGAMRMESVNVDLQIAKRRFPYIKWEVIGPSAWAQGGVSRYGIASSQRSRSAFDHHGETLETIRHENVPLGHSMLFDVLQSRKAEAKFPVLYQVSRHFDDYVHYEIWGPENLRNPTRGGTAFLLGSSRLGKRGEDLPGLLHAIRMDGKHWPELLKDLREAYPRIEEINFRRGIEARELGLVFRESTANKPLIYRPSQMSDGFLRLLALLALKYQPRPLSLLGYEEPENGLHPTALDDCMRHLKAIARNGTQVIVTTHSPYLLNHLLEDEAEPRAELRLVMRDKKEGKTTIAPPDPEKIAHARKQGFGIGELWGMLLNEKELAKK